MSSDYDRRLAWFALAMTCLSVVVGIFAVLFPDQRTLLIVAAIIFLLVGLYSLSKSFSVGGSSRFISRLYGSKWRLNREREKQNKTWHTAKNIEIVIKDSHVSLQSMHGLSIVPWPTLTQLTATADIEVINHHDREYVELVSIYFGLYDPATGIEVMPSQAREPAIEGGFPEIKPSGRQAYSVKMNTKYGKWIKRGDVDVYLIVEVSGRKWQRVRINEVAFL
jgi:hypothetical protein